MRIELQNIKYKYNSDFGIEIDNLIINSGETVAVVGKTGSGKTTFLNLLAALLPFDKGEYFYGGESVKNKAGLKKLRSDVGYVFQFPEKSLFEKTIKKELLYSLRKTGLTEEEKEGRLKETVEKFALKEFDLSESPHGLSGGEKRRLALASVFIKKPKVLLLDEPISGLDAVTREAFLDGLESLGKTGVTVVMVTHSPEAASRMKRLISFDRGKVKFDGESRAVFQDRYKCYSVGINPPEITEISEILYKKGYDIKPTPDIRNLISQILRVKGILDE